MSSYYRNYHQQDSGLFSKRTIILAVIIAFHGLIIWGFIAGIGNTGRAILQTILQTNIIQQQKVQELPPPPPHANLNVPPPTQVIAPDVVINIPTPPAPIHVKPPPPAPRVIHVAPVPVIPVRVTFAPDPSDYYPESSRRNNEEGRVMVHICVNTRGQVATATVETSSGHHMLDQAGLQLAKATRFKPATRGGKPIEQCTLLPVKFVLTQ